MILLQGGRLLTCEDESVIDDGSVLLDGDRISWVGPTRELPQDSEVSEVVDAAGLTILPGLIDPHMHISFGEARTEEELQIYTPMPHRAIRAAADAQKVLLAGVTSATEPGGAKGIGVAVRDAIEAGLIQGPSMSVAGRQMSTQQGIGGTLPEWLGQIDQSYGALIHTLDDVRRVIRDEVKEGVDLVKVAISGPGTEEHAAMTLDELSTAVDQAHSLGRPVTVHARSRQSVALAVDARVDWIMHASFMDEATLDRVVDAGIPILPAMTLLVNLLEAAPGYMSPAALDGVRRELDAASAILSKARDLGVTLIAGSETGFGMTPYGEWHAREMQIFVDLLGMRDHEALLCMTRNAALACPRFTRDIGTLTAGKYADILLVRGEPDRDVRVLQDRSRIAAIIQRGSPVTAWRPEDAPRRRMASESARRYVAEPYRSPVGGLPGRLARGETS